MSCVGCACGGQEAPQHMQCISDVDGQQLLTGMPLVLTEKTVTFVMDSVVVRSVELCGAIWDVFSNEGFSRYCA